MKERGSKVPIIPWVIAEEHNVLKIDDWSGSGLSVRWDNGKVSIGSEQLVDVFVATEIDMTRLCIKNPSKNRYYK